MAQYDWFTREAQDAIWRAFEIKDRFNHNQIEIEHILLALLEQPENSIPQILDILNINSQSVAEILDRALHTIAFSSDGKIGRIHITPQVKKIIDRANDEAIKIGDKQISTEHLLLAILKDENKSVYHIIEKENLNYEQVFHALKQIRNRMNVHEIVDEKKESLNTVVSPSLKESDLSANENEKNTKRSTKLKYIKKIIDIKTNYYTVSTSDKFPDSYYTFGPRVQNRPLISGKPDFFTDLFFYIREGRFPNTKLTFWGNTVYDEIPNVQSSRREGPIVFEPGYTQTSEKKIYQGSVSVQVDATCNKCKKIFEYTYSITAKNSKSDTPKYLYNMRAFGNLTIS